MIQFGEDRDFVEARVRFPLDFWNKSAKQKSLQPKEGISKRLDTRIVRDVDVVTQTNAQALTQTETVLNTTTGTAQKIYTVDNTASRVETEVTSVPLRHWPQRKPLLLHTT